MHDENQITLDKNKKISAELLTLENTRKTLEAAKRTLEEKIYGPGGPAPRLARPTDTRSASEIAETDKELTAAKAEIKSLGKEVKVRQDKIKAAEAATQKARDALQARSEELERPIKGLGQARARVPDSAHVWARGRLARPSRALNEHFKREREVLGELVKQHSNVEAHRQRIYPWPSTTALLESFYSRRPRRAKSGSVALGGGAGQASPGLRGNASSTDDVDDGRAALLLQEGIIDATGKQTELQGEKKALEKGGEAAASWGRRRWQSIPSGRRDQEQH